MNNKYYLNLNIPKARIWVCVVYLWCTGNASWAVDTEKESKLRKAMIIRKVSVAELK